jgi:hypothetical protein
MSSANTNDQTPVSKDIYLTCMDCSGEFLYAIGEQRFFRERGLAAPKRCKGCRLERRQKRAARLR